MVNQTTALVFRYTISLSHKKVLFQKIVMTSLHVICGFAPAPNQKSWLRLWFYHNSKSRKHQKLLITIIAASLENLKEIANQSDSIGIVLN